MLKFTLVKTFETTSPAALPAIVKELEPWLHAKTLLLLEGPVGAGKTEFTKALTRHFALPETVSPSFAIHHRYEGISPGGRVVDHVDLYRLESEDDLESTGFWDLFRDEDSLIVIEWADRLNLELLPLDWDKLKIEIETHHQAKRRTLRVYQARFSGS
jgi:tRNA threonylcarbamoyladenosine biosynthesis protein TsaE